MKQVIISVGIFFGSFLILLFIAAVLIHASGILKDNTKYLGEVFGIVELQEGRTYSIYICTYGEVPPNTKGVKVIIPSLDSLKTTTLVKRKEGYTRTVFSEKGTISLARIAEVASPQTIALELVLEFSPPNTFLGIGEANPVQNFLIIFSAALGAAFASGFISIKALRRMK